MPVASHQVIQPKEEQKLSLRLEPAHAAYSDLFLLDKVNHLAGVDRWVERTLEQLSEERISQHHQVLNGLYYALMPRVSYSDFESYLEDLAAQDPEQWIDRLFEAYERMSKKREGLTATVRDELLADFEAYLEYLYQRFDSSHIDVEVERKVHEWLAKPEEMQQEALEHLRFMWQEHLKPAWIQALPLMEDSARSFNQVDWPEGSELEVAEWVTGHELNEWEQGMLAKAERVVFVPSTHVGPYLISLMPESTLWLVFGARIPEGASVQSAALSRSQLLMRLNALADENRLHILDLLREHGEMCAQEIMDVIELSQSSISRHLRQLSATGYVLERRRESAKCYRLNPDQSYETVAALADFLEVEC